MNLRKSIAKEDISISLESNTKDEVIVELLDMLVASGKITDRKAALKAVMDREKKMSTGMQHNIAIPHGKTSTVDSLVSAIGIKKEGIEFESIDGSPSQIFILTVSPANRTGPHIQFLAEISRLLNEEAVREQVLNSDSAEAVYEIMLSH